MENHSIKSDLCAHASPLRARKSHARRHTLICSQSRFLAEESLRTRTINLGMVSLSILHHFSAGAHFDHYSLLTYITLHILSMYIWQWIPQSFGSNILPFCTMMYALCQYALWYGWRPKQSRIATRLTNCASSECGSCVYVQDGYVGLAEHTTQTPHSEPIIYVCVFVFVLPGRPRVIEPPRFNRPKSKSPPASFSYTYHVRAHQCLLVRGALHQINTRAVNTIQPRHFRLWRANHIARFIGSNESRGNWFRLFGDQTMLHCGDVTDTGSPAIEIGELLGGRL